MTEFTKALQIRPEPLSIHPDFAGRGAHIAAPVLEMPRSTKLISCGKCGRGLTVSDRTVLAFCRDCSATMGVKK